MAGYVTLKDCRMIPRGGNDGDSYRVRHSEGEEAFRLYFVDTPETNPEEEERLRFQSRYFDSTPDAMLAAGQEAKEYVHGLMQPGKFEVITRWEQVMDGPRYHAFIAVNGRHLHELLVEKGLARIYTMPADLPDGTSKEKHLRYLKSLEAKARQAGRGAWASQ
jgi:endonuclease YncB( thermonuclease family)